MRDRFVITLFIITRGIVNSGGVHADVTRYYVLNLFLIGVSDLTRRWEDNIRMDLEEIGINAGNWVDSTQDRNYWRALVNAALNFRVP